MSICGLVSVDVDKTGDFYKGGFIIDKDKRFTRHGLGMMRYKNCSFYYGNWMFGKKHG